MYRSFRVYVKSEAALAVRSRLYIHEKTCSIKQADQGLDIFETVYDCKKETENTHFVL